MEELTVFLDLLLSHRVSKDDYCDKTSNQKAVLQINHSNSLKDWENIGRAGMT